MEMMEIEPRVGGSRGERQPIITLEEEEDVVLYWDQGKKHKSFRELSIGAGGPDMEGLEERNQEDVDVLKYYRCTAFVMLLLLLNDWKFMILSLLHIHHHHYFLFLLPSCAEIEVTA